jgi:hypothetical protein
MQQVQQHAVQCRAAPPNICYTCYKVSATAAKTHTKGSTQQAASVLAAPASLMIVRSHEQHCTSASLAGNRRQNVATLVSAAAVAALVLCSF